MILSDFKAFPRTGRILGVDWGARRTGLAVSDETRAFVFTRPAIVSPRGKSGVIADRIAAIARDEAVVGIIIGMPMHSDGTASDTAIAVRDMAQRLSDLMDIPIAFIDETLTSFAAQEDIGRARISDIKQRLDSESARVILENAIAILKRTNK